MFHPSEELIKDALEFNKMVEDMQESRGNPRECIKTLLDLTCSHFCEFYTGSAAHVPRDDHMEHFVAIKHLHNWWFRIRLQRDLDSDDITIRFYAQCKLPFQTETLPSEEPDPFCIMLNEEALTRCASLCTTAYRGWMFFLPLGPRISKEDFNEGVRRSKEDFKQKLLEQKRSFHQNVVPLAVCDAVLQYAHEWLVPAYKARLLLQTNPHLATIPVATYDGEHLYWN